MMAGHRPKPTSSPASHDTAASRIAPNQQSSRRQTQHLAVIQPSPSHYHLTHNAQARFPRPYSMTTMLKEAWYKWKSLRLPWRKQWLVGADLSGNTFWEFKDALNANRLRRIVRYTRKIHYADVKISPQWHQWLRHTRDNAPSIQEQQFDVSRQAMMKRLAAEADERWKSLPSYLDAPRTQQPQPAIGVQHPGGYAQATEEEEKQEKQEKQGVKSAVESEVVDEGKSGDDMRDRRTRGTKKPKENPWAHLQPKGAPSESWQPQEWSPGVAQRGR